jgi:hypothetical protein
MIGVTQYTQENFKGKIKQYIEAIEKGNYKNNKIYFNVLKVFYSCCEYDKEEMKILDNKYKNACVKCDNERQETKTNEDTEHFKICYWELQAMRDLHKKTYKTYGLFSDLINWLISALYCDENFGPKRPIDIINLRRENIDIKNRKIMFTAVKNNFKYESEPLSDEIWEPLKIVYDKNYKSYLLLSSTLNKFSVETFNYRFKKYVFKSLNINPQICRRLYASYHWSEATPKQLLKQAYELNHTIGVHIESYISPYKDYKFIKTVKF